MPQNIFIPLLNDEGDDSEISLHFGHAPYFGLYDLKTKKLIIKKNELSHNDLNKTPVDQVIESANPQIVYALDMGQRAIRFFKEKNVKLKTGSYKILKEVIENINSLEDLDESCGH